MGSGQHLILNSTQPTNHESKPMRHIPATDYARPIEELAAESRRLFSKLPQPTRPAQVWDPESLSYVSNLKPPTLWDCVYIDRRGNERIWVSYADSLKEVITNFNELVGEGRIVSVLPAAEWD